MWAIVENGSVREIVTQPKAVVVNGFLQSRDIFTKWSAAELKAAGILPVETQTPSDLTEFHQYVGETFQIEEDRVVRIEVYEPIPLEEAKQIARNRINRWKATKQDSNFVYNGVEYQCDPRSREFITGAALDATICLINQEPFEIQFTDAFNVPRTLDANQMISLARAAKAHVEYWHEQGLIKKAQVDAAESIENIKAVLDSLEDGGA